MSKQNLKLRFLWKFCCGKCYKNQSICWDRGFCILYLYNSCICHFRGFHELKSLKLPLHLFKLLLHLFWLKLYISRFKELRVSSSSTSLSKYTCRLSAFYPVFETVNLPSSKLLSFGLLWYWKCFEFKGVWV